MSLEILSKGRKPHEPITLSLIQKQKTNKSILELIEDVVGLKKVQKYKH